MARRLLLTVFILQVIIQFACPLQFKLVAPPVDDKKDTKEYEYVDGDDEYYYYDDNDDEYYKAEEDEYYPDVKASVRPVYKESDKCPNYSKASKLKCEKDKKVQCKSNDDCYEDELCCTVDCERKCIQKETPKRKPIKSKVSNKKSTYSSKNNKNKNRNEKRKNRKGNRRGFAKSRDYDENNDNHALSGDMNYGKQKSGGMDYGFGYGNQYQGYGAQGFGTQGIAGQRQGFGAQGMVKQRHGYGNQGMNMGSGYRQQGYGGQRQGMTGQKHAYGNQGLNKRNGYSKLGMRQNQGFVNNHHMLSGSGGQGHHNQGGNYLVGNQSPGFGYGNGMQDPTFGNHQANQNLGSTHPLLDRLSKKLSHTKPGSGYKDQSFQRFGPNFY